MRADAAGARLPTVSEECGRCLAAEVRRERRREDSRRRGGGGTAGRNIDDERRMRYRRCADRSESYAGVAVLLVRRRGGLRKVLKRVLERDLRRDEERRSEEQPR